MKFNKVYILLTAALFIVEVLIAEFAHDDIIRPYVGDLLVVILLYCFVKSFFDTPVFGTAVGVLLFSYFIEALQYFHFINKLGLQASPIARTIIGTSFEWIDIIAYTIGIAVVLYVEKTILKKNITRNSTRNPL
jgi:hypothetical protein